jgi:hypothetical protein
LRMVIAAGHGGPDGPMAHYCNQCAIRTMARARR